MQPSRAFTRLVAAGSKISVRKLHMTGPAPFASHLTFNQPIALGQHTSAHIPEGSEKAKSNRQFNTSRSLKSPGDSSTMDFLFVPDLDFDLNSTPLEVRVPVLPWVESTEATRADAIEPHEAITLPKIHTLAADGTHIHAPSFMFDVSDSQHQDYQGLASHVTTKIVNEADKGASKAKELWSGLMNDIKHGSPKGSMG